LRGIIERDIETKYPTKPRPWFSIAVEVSARRWWPKTWAKWLYNAISLDGGGGLKESAPLE